MPSSSPRLIFLRNVEPARLSEINAQAHFLESEAFYKTITTHSLG
jgi:hypothetical protein